MLASSTKTQMNIMFHRKEFKAAALLVSAYACLNFIYILAEAWGTDVSMIKDANHSVCYLSTNRLWNFFVMLYPFIIVLPFATSYIDDHRNQLLPVYISRISRKDYYLSKILACFTGTALVIAVPFLANLLFCCFFLPHNNNTWLGEYQMGNYCRTLLGTNLLYETPYARLPFLDLYIYSPFLYNLMYLFLFSVFSGLLGTLVLGFSFWWKKNKIVLFLPVFVIKQLLGVYDAWRMSDAINGGREYINFDITEYFVPSLSKGRGPLFMVLVITVILAVLAGFTAYAVRDDLGSMQ